MLQGDGAGVVGEVHPGEPESFAARARSVGKAARRRRRVYPRLRQRDVGAAQRRQQHTQCPSAAARGRQGRTTGSPSAGTPSLPFLDV